MSVESLLKSASILSNSRRGDNQSRVAPQAPLEEQARIKQRVARKTGAHENGSKSMSREGSTGTVSDPENPKSHLNGSRPSADSRSDYHRSRRHRLTDETKAALVEHFRGFYDRKLAPSITVCWMSFCHQQITRGANQIPSYEQYRRAVNLSDQRGRIAKSYRA
jgi:hypothetical protein